VTVTDTKAATSTSAEFTIDVVNSTAALVGPYALIEGGVVINAMSWDGITPWTPLPGQIAVRIPAGSNAWTGWGYDGTTFTPPPATPLSVAGYAVVQAGVVVAVDIWDGVTPWPLPAGTIAVNIRGATVGVGWTYDGTTFTPPPSTPGPVVYPYAIIQAGIVINVTSWDGITPWTPPPGDIAVRIPAGSNAWIGWGYDGTHFTPPPAPT
jgi:hypothetical protein